MGCLSSLAKYILFIFNLLIVAGAAALIAIGVIIIVHEQKGIGSFTDFSVGGFAIAVGVVIFIIAFFGCCGAIKQNGCMLITYAVILIIILVLQIVLAALIFVNIKNNSGELDKKFHKMVEDVFKKNKTDVLDDIQKTFKCCGIDGPKDWPSKIPLSCCPNKEQCSKSDDAFQIGCAAKFQEYITDNVKIIGGVAIGFAVVELFGAVFAFCVRNKRS